MSEETNDEPIAGDSPMKIRRAITGRDDSNKSVFVLFGSTPRVITFDTMPGTVFWEIYATDEMPALSGQEPDPIPDLKSLTPGPDGSRFRLVQFAPSPPEEFEIDHGAFQMMKKEALEKLPGLAEHLEWSNFPMHTTDTLDYGVVIRGEIILELDDGKSVHLQQGDCIVQNGTRHRWNNPLTEPCLMAFVMIGAIRR
jgi:mannose-6-phosphate isomerase-like protein (cupin superfamily)